MLSQKRLIQCIGIQTIGRSFIRSPPRPSISLALRAFASSHNHHDHHDHHHEHREQKHPFPEETTNKLWIIGSALLFGPVVWYMTEKKSSQKKNHHPEPQIHLVALESDHASKSTEADDSTPTPVLEVTTNKISATAIVPAVQYVLVGAGMASYHAMKAIKEQQPDADILIIGDETYAPYQRPPLSKELWSSPHSKDLIFKDYTGSNRSIFYESPETYEILTTDQFDSLATPSSKVRILTNIKVFSLNPDTETLQLEDGRMIKYSKVLLATGGTPKKLSISKSLSEEAQKKVLTLRGLDDFKTLHEIQSQGNKTIAIIGGGFLGSELAVALAKQAKENGNKIIQVFPEDGNMSLVFPKYLTKWTTAKLIEEGVQVKPNLQLNSFGEEDGQIVLDLKWEKLTADYVVLAIGITPNVDIAKRSGLETDDIRGGIIVNAELEARRNVFGAGDCISYHDISLGRRRVEHYDHAAMSGRLAGLNMTGARKPYTHQSMFWSDLGPAIGYEAVGVIDSNLSSVGIWAVDADHPRTEDAEDEYHKGIVYYLTVKEKKLMGILLFNTFGRVDEARAILKEGRTFENVSELSDLIKV